MTYHYVIDDIPPSLNKYAGRLNAWEYREDKQIWKQLVYFSTLQGERPAAPPPFAFVRIVYFFPDKRRHDPDNYAGKMILDGLTAAGIIEDDSFDHIALLLSGDVDRQNPRTEIFVTPVRKAAKAVKIIVSEMED